MQKKSIFFNQKGATAVECAIILSLLLTLIFGITEFSLFIFNRQVITNAAREGARAGIVARPVRLPNVGIPPDIGISDVVLKYCAQNLITFGGSKDPTITIKPVNLNPSVGFDPNTERCVVFEFKDAAGVFHRCDLEVTVDYTYEFLFLSNLGIGPINLRAISGMRME